MDEEQKQVTIDPAVTFTEVMPGTYCAFFSDYSPDPMINSIQARTYLDLVKQAASQHPGEKINIINDTTVIGKRVLSLSGEARKFYLEAYRHPQIGQVAMVGFGPWLKTFISLLAQFAGRSSQTAFFDTLQEAEGWIRTTATPPQ